MLSLLTIIMRVHIKIGKMRTALFLSVLFFTLNIQAQTYYSGYYSGYYYYYYCPPTSDSSSSSGNYLPSSNNEDAPPSTNVDLLFSGNDVVQWSGNAGASVNLNENSDTYVIATVAHDSTHNNVVYSIDDDAINLGFSIDHDTGEISASSLDYETSPFGNNDQLNIVVTATIDSQSFSEILTINLIDINEAPTNIAISQVNTITISQVQIINADKLKVATFTIIDDALGQNEASLAGDDAEFFQIINDEVFLREGVTLEAGATFNLSIVVTDPTIEDNEELTVNFTISVKPSEISFEGPTSLRASYFSSIAGNFYVNGGSLKTVNGMQATRYMYVWGKHGSLILDGHCYFYTLSGYGGRNVLKLKEGESITETFTFVADSGATKDLVITINGKNDPPTDLYFEGEGITNYSGSRGAYMDLAINKRGHIATAVAKDVDSTAFTYSINSIYGDSGGNVWDNLHIDSSTGRISVTGELPSSLVQHKAYIYIKVFDGQYYHWEVLRIYFKKAVIEEAVTIEGSAQERSNFVCKYKLFTR